MDVKSAFLDSPLAETVYMEQPKGLSSGDNKVCLLQRSLFGLRQIARDWYQTVSTFLLDERFTRSSNDFSWCNDLCAGLGRWHHYWVQMSRRSWQAEELFLRTSQDWWQWRIVRVPGNTGQAVTWDGKSKPISFQWRLFGAFWTCWMQTIGTPADISAQLSTKPALKLGQQRQYP